MLDTHTTTKAQQLLRHTRRKHKFFQTHDKSTLLHQNFFTSKKLLSSLAFLLYLLLLLFLSQFGGSNSPYAKVLGASAKGLTSTSGGHFGGRARECDRFPMLDRTMMFCLKIIEINNAFKRNNRLVRPIYNLSYIHQKYENSHHLFNVDFAKRLNEQLNSNFCWS